MTSGTDPMAIWRIAALCRFTKSEAKRLVTPRAVLIERDAGHRSPRRRGAFQLSAAPLRPEARYRGALADNSDRTSASSCSAGQIASGTLLWVDKRDDEAVRFDPAGSEISYWG